jgi:integrase/recombinase XerD
MLSHTIQDYIVHLRASGRAQSTIHCYQRDLERLTRILRNKSIHLIRAEHLERAVVKICDTLQNGARRSAATMNRIKSAYRSFFQWAFDSRRITRNPAARLRLAKTHSRRTTPITVQEIDILLNTIRASDDRHAHRDEALFATYAYTGIRRSEVLPLTSLDYDPHSETLYLSKTKNSGGHIRIAPSPLAEILANRIRLMHSGNPASGSCLFFPGRTTGEPLCARQAQARFAKWKQRAGLRKTLTIHSFRAGFATSLYQSTGDILLVARAMGHSDIRTTKRYIHEHACDIRWAVEKAFSA